MLTRLRNACEKHKAVGYGKGIRSCKIKYVSSLTRLAPIHRNYAGTRLRTLEIFLKFLSRIAYSILHELAVGEQPSYSRRLGLSRSPLLPCSPGEANGGPKFLTHAQRCVFDDATNNLRGTPTHSRFTPPLKQNIRDLTSIQVVPFGRTPYTASHVFVPFAWKCERYRH